MYFFLQNNGQHISWKHIEKLYEFKTSMAKDSHGLFLLKHLSIEHIRLTSYSRMRVDLAVQVRCIV